MSLLSQKNAGVLILVDFLSYELTDQVIRQSREENSLVTEIR